MSRKRTTGKRGRSRKRVGRRKRTTKSVTKLVNRFRSQAIGRGARSPKDHFIFAQPTITDQTSANVTESFCSDIWANGLQIASILTNIRDESQFDLAAGITYQPTLLVSGYTDIEILAAGVGAVNYEIVLGTSRTDNSAGAASTATTFSTSWAQSFDTVPTLFAFYPSTSLLQNHAFWGARTSGGLKATARRIGTARVGRVKRIRFRFATRRFDFATYSSSSFLTGGQAKDKSHRAIMRFWGERGQVCGVKSAVNTPLLSEVGTQFIVRQRQHYFYRWVAGNNKASVYGDQMALNESVNVAAVGFIGVPALKAQRGGAFSAAAEVGAGFPEYGALNPHRKLEVDINPLYDCVPDPYVPQVHDVGP